MKTNLEDDKDIGLCADEIERSETVMQVLQTDDSP